MRLEIRRRDVEITEDLRTYLEERLWLALGHFDSHVKVVRAYLRDVNGPRGGLDKLCRIVVELDRRGRVVVTGMDTDIRAAVGVAAIRAGVAVKRHVKRGRARRRPPRGRTLPLVAA